MDSFIIIKNDDRAFDEWFDLTGQSTTNLNKVFKKYELNYVDRPFYYYEDDDRENLVCLLYGKLINGIIEIQKMVFDERVLKEPSTAEIHRFLKAFVHDNVSNIIIFRADRELPEFYIKELYQDFDYKIEKQQDGTYLHKWTYIRK